MSVQKRWERMLLYEDKLKDGTQCITKVISEFQSISSKTVTIINDLLEKESNILWQRHALDIDHVEFPHNWQSPLITCQNIISASCDYLYTDWYICAEKILRKKNFNYGNDFPNWIKPYLMGLIVSLLLKQDKLVSKIIDFPCHYSLSKHIRLQVKRGMGLNPIEIEIELETAFLCVLSYWYSKKSFHKIEHLCKFIEKSHWAPPKHWLKLLHQIDQNKPYLFIRDINSYLKYFFDKERSPYGGPYTSYYATILWNLAENSGMDLSQYYDSIFMAKRLNLNKPISRKGPKRKVTYNFIQIEQKTLDYILTRKSLKLE
jgi:hypothetical protein